jgi:hypothetical protein
MTDERKIVKMRLGKDWTENGNILTTRFLGVDIDGEYVRDLADPIVFDRRKATAEMRDQAERHGWEQKHGDCAAIPKDTKSGKSATVEEKRAAVLASCERFEGGATAWTLKGGGGMSEDALIAKLMSLGYDVSKKSAPPVDVTPQG